MSDELKRQQEANEEARKKLSEKATPVNWYYAVACQSIYQRFLEQVVDLLNWAFYLREQGVWLKELINLLTEIRDKIPQAYNSDLWVNWFFKGVEPAAHKDWEREKRGE